MKTITLKADKRFDDILTRLAEELNTTKSGVIREAVSVYKQHVEREALARSVRRASLKVRVQAERAEKEFSGDLADGL